MTDAAVPTVKQRLAGIRHLFDWLVHTEVVPTNPAGSVRGPAYSQRHSKVIGANAGEAPDVIDGLLDHESGIAIREHATDTAGAVDHVFGLCPLLDFRFAPRIRDLGERRLYAMSNLTHWPTLRPLIAGPVNLRAIEDDWDETLRLPPRATPAPLPNSRAFE